MVRACCRTLLVDELKTGRCSTNLAFVLVKVLVQLKLDPGIAAYEVYTVDSRTDTL